MLDHLLRAAPPDRVVSDVASWFEHLASCPFDKTLDRALWGGFEADRLGYAFVAGYQAALERLVPTSAGSRLSLAATEAGGGHPRAIRTTLSDGMLLRGEKTFATLATAADALLVVASRGESADGRPNLIVVRVDAKASGVVIEERKAIPVAPEIPHAKVTFTDVVVQPDDILPGDGYARYLKPFRTIEDIHVLAATLGYVMKVARANGFDPAVPEAIAALVLALTQASERDASDPVGHIALRGIFTTTRDLITTHDREWDKANEETRDRWHRDVALLLVAETARQKRTETAWQALR